MAEKKKLSPTSAKLMKGVDLEETTSLTDQVYIGCSQRDANTHIIIVFEEKNVHTHQTNTDAELDPKQNYLVVSWGYDV